MVVCTGTAVEGQADSSAALHASYDDLTPVKSELTTSSFLGFPYFLLKYDLVYNPDFVRISN